MDFFDVIHTRRSVRQYMNQPVSRSVLEQIVQAGNEAPTGCNAQLKQYVIIDDPAVMDQIRTVSKALTGATAAIVLLVDPKPTAYGEFWIQDASAAMAQMLLAAVALGYAGCWVEGAVRRAEDSIRRILNVPGHLRIWSMMPVGRPDDDQPRVAKPDLGSVLHVNGY